jgi:hypothetical protein
MKISNLLFCTALTLSGNALAQTSVQGGAAAQSNTSVSSNRSGASASQDSAAGAAVASERGSASAAQGTEMNATLSKPIDARRAKPGDEVTATLAQDTEANGQVMPRGTTLVGRVTEAQPRRRSSDGNVDSRLGVVFDKAVLEDGREVPIAATVQAVAAADAAASSGARSFDGAAAAVRARPGATMAS